MRSVICDSRISPKAERRLRILGFEPILLPASSNLGEAVRSHPDTLICRIGDTLITSADYCEEASYIFSDIRERAPHIKIKVASEELSAKYPGDCKLNALISNQRIFLKKDSISDAVISEALAHGLKVISVKQGYPACSALSLGDAIITADEGLIRAAENAETKAYRIECGHISLPPHEYGFIGGATGVFEKRIYFHGDYKLHPSWKTIEEAADERGFELISLSDEPLSDIGGLIFL